MPRYSPIPLGRATPRLPDARPGSTDIVSGEQILRGQQITSANGQYRIAFQTDGNVVEYLPGGKAPWATNTAGSNAQRLVMQGDGNLVLYDAANHPLWASNTAGHPGAFAVLQDDANFVVYDGTRPLWSSWAAGGFHERHA